MGSRENGPVFIVHFLAGTHFGRGNFKVSAASGCFFAQRAKHIYFPVLSASEAFLSRGKVASGENGPVFIVYFFVETPVAAERGCLRLPFPETTWDFGRPEVGMFLLVFSQSPRFCEDDGGLRTA